MGKQKLQQKLSQNISTKQIQFLNLLQIPITSLQERIQKELEDNPTLEENEENEEDVFSENNTGSSNFHNTKNDYNLVQIEDKKETLANYLSEQLINLELDDKKTFLIIALIFVLLLIFYFIASPYQNCVRNASNPVWCSTQTSW